MIPHHTIGIITGSNTARADIILVGVQSKVANAIGGGAGVAVTTTVTFSKELPPNYAVHITPAQDAVAYVNNRTASGFDVVLNPRLAANTLAVGTFDILVVG